MKHSTKHPKQYLEKRYHRVLKQFRMNGLSTYAALRHLEHLLNTHKGI